MSTDYKRVVIISVKTILINMTTMMRFGSLVYYDGLNQYSSQ